MGLFDVFKADTDKVVVHTGRSKGPSRIPVIIAVGDIKKGIVYDAAGYKNEIVLFLRKNKEDK